MMTTQDIRKECEKIFNKIGLTSNGIDIVINGRLTKTLGRCCYKKECGKVIPVRLEFSRLLLETATPHSISEVIYHECAHAIACIETGESQKHNAYFKSVCQRIGTCNDGISTTVEHTVDEATIYKYFVICKDCGKVCGKYHRAGNVVKYPSNYSCKCGGSLSIVQNF